MVYMYKLCMILYVHGGLVYRCCVCKHVGWMIPLVCLCLGGYVHVGWVDGDA